MSMSVTIDKVSALAEDGVWRAELAPSAIQRLGKAENSIGENSVLLISDPLYQSAGRELRFRLENTTVLNVGTTSRAIFLSAGQAKTGAAEEDAAASHGAEAATQGTSVGDYGPGDHKFLASLKEVPVPIRETGQELLSRIRQKFPGDLRPYDQRRFINAPDNFWGVQIQIRKQMLKISVRGVPDRFPATGLRVWLDRPPVYSAFKLERASQVDDAMRIIDHADRKGV